MVTVIRAGKAVQLIWNLYTPDPTLLPAIIMKPYDPPSVPVITIFDPNGATQVSAQPTTKLAPGIYSFTYTTGTGGVLGVWTAYLDVTDSSGVPSGSVDAPDLQKATPLFQLV